MLLDYTDELLISVEFLLVGNPPLVCSLIFLPEHNSPVRSLTDTVTIQALRSPGLCFSCYPQLASLMLGVGVGGMCALSGSSSVSESLMWSPNISSISEKNPL